MRNNFEPSIAIPAGETLVDIIEDRGMTEEELASKMELPLDIVLNILSGNQAITNDIARNLEDIFNISESFWNNLEYEYQQTLHRINKQTRLNKKANQKRNKRRNRKMDTSTLIIAGVAVVGMSLLTAFLITKKDKCEIKGVSLRKVN